MSDDPVVLAQVEFTLAFTDTGAYVAAVAETPELVRVELRDGDAARDVQVTIEQAGDLRELRKIAKRERKAWARALR